MSTTTVESLELKISSNSKSASDGVDKLTASLNKLHGATKGGLGLDSTNDKMKRFNTTLSQASANSLKLGIKLGVTAVAIRKVAKDIWSCIKESNDYVENVNLFTVSMGEYANEAREYAETVGEVMGIDPGEWMRNQGIFMTLATGFGIAGDRASVMSQQLTQLGYDLSSFFNIKVEDAMQKLQSGISGELEPLRRLGYDLSQAKLEATALSLGIDKSVSSMTQAEKAQLRYYAIMTQVTTAQGDMARTLEAPANQLRILKAQFTQATRAIGNIFIPILNKVLPYLIAVTKIVRILANEIASLFGYELPEVDYSGVKSTVGSVSEGLDDATESAKKLKSYMLGFDELNVIDPNSGNSGTEDIGSQFDFELPTYDFIGEATESKVSQIVEEMKEWLGLTQEIGTWADLLDTKFGKILTTVGLIGGGILTWKVGEGLYVAIGGIATAFSNISTVLSSIAAAIGAISAPVLAIVAAVLAVAAGLTAVYLTNESIRTSVNEAVISIGEAFLPLIEYIVNTVIPDLRLAWDGLVEILTPLGDWLSMVFVSIWEDMLIPALNFLSEKVIPDVTRTFKNLWEKVLVPLGKLIGDILTPVVDILAEVLTMLWQYVIVPLADCIGGVLSTAWDGLVKILNVTVIPIVQKVIEVLTFLWNKVLSPIIDFLWDIFKPVVETVFKGVGEIIGNIKNVFSGLINFVTGIFTADWKQAWDGIVQMFSGIWGGLKAIIKIPLNACLSFIEGFINKIIDGWNWLKRQINSLSIEIPDWLGGGTLGFDLAMSDPVSLPRLADGGMVDNGQMFIAREAGPELVGSIGRRTAVANNDQIVDGIANGVAEANSEQTLLLREQNSLLRALLEKESGVYLDGRSLTNSVEKYQRERGRVLITGGVV